MSDDGVVQMRRSEVYTFELMREHMQTQPVVLFMKGIFQFRSASFGRNRQIRGKERKVDRKGKHKATDCSKMKKERPRNGIAKQATRSEKPV